MGGGGKCEHGAEMLSSMVAKNTSWQTLSAQGAVKYSAPSRN